jgi:hypothetical protein
MREREKMLGYNYKDIQEFGATLEQAELYIPLSNTQAREGLVKIWDFFEGLLAEGYVEGEEIEV